MNRMDVVRWYTQPMAPEIRAPVSVETFWRLANRYPHAELVGGQVIELVPPGFRHGAIAVTLARHVGEHVEQQGLGIVVADSGFVLSTDPPTVRGPDVAVVLKARVPSPLPVAFFPGPPDLAVEVLSPDEGPSEVAAKVADYLRAGDPSRLGGRCSAGDADGAHRAWCGHLSPGRDAPWRTSVARLRTSSLGTVLAGRPILGSLSVWLYRQDSRSDYGRISDHHRTRSGNYSAYLPDLPGCVATGATPEEAEANIRDAVRLHLDGLKAEGLPIPQPSTLAARIAL